MEQSYDVVVIGAGSGGISAAHLARGFGKQVALVEKSKIGGDCTWYGCVPSKALIRAGEIAYAIKHHGDFELRLKGSWKLDARDALSFVRKIREQVYSGETPDVFREKGIDVLLGAAKFLDPQRLLIGDQVVAARKFIIATGSHPLVPSIDGLNTVPFYTNETIFDLDRLPASLIVLGGGPIGVELAAAFNRLGVKVTIIEMLDRILIREEPELVAILTQQLQEEGVCISTSTKAVRIRSQSGLIGLEAQVDGDQKVVFEAEVLLVAVGRQPNVQGLDLEKAGVDYTPNGISINSYMQTTMPHIFACGDVASPFLFSHVAEYQATIAVRNAVLPRFLWKKGNYSNVPWCTFTDPELARWGFTEEEARDRFGSRIRVFRFPLSGVDRAKTDGATRGMSKLITDKKGKLLGIHVLAPHAGEVLHEALVAKQQGVPLQKLAEMIHIYPTYNDLIKRPAAQCFVEVLQDRWFIRWLQQIRKMIRN